jgi:hypothetical protein
MDNIDITTAGGVAAGALIVIAAIKKIFVNFELKQYPWYPSAMNLATLIIAFGLSFGTLAFYPETKLTDAIINGVLGFLLAIGGYEPIVNLLRGLLNKK